MSVHHKYTKDFKEKIENLIKFYINFISNLRLSA